MKKHIPAVIVSLVVLFLLAPLCLAATRWKTTNITSVPVTVTYVDPNSFMKVVSKFTGVLNNFIVMDLDTNNHHAFYLHTEDGTGALEIDESAVGSGVTNGSKTSVLAAQGVPMSSNKIVLPNGTLAPDAVIMNCDYTRNANTQAVTLKLKMTAAGIFTVLGRPTPGIVSLSVSASGIPKDAEEVDGSIGRDYAFPNLTGMKPTAIDHAVSLPFGNSGTIDLTEGGFPLPLSASVVSGPFNGAIPGSTNLPTGVATYTPSAGFSGVDTFTYFLRNALNVSSDVKTVTVTVGGRPVAQDGLVRPILKNSTTANVINLASFVTNMPNGNIRFTNITGVPFGNVSGVFHGTLSNKDRVNGKVTYRPLQGFSGEDHFVYTIEDMLGYSSSGTVTLDVIPFAVDDLFSVRASAITPSQLDVLANDSGVGSGTNMEIVSVFTNTSTTGVVAISNDKKSILYSQTRPPGTTDTFTYTMTDTSLPADNRPVSTATVIVNITP